MIVLDKVSKIYYQNGVIATGFNNVSLKLNIGEFVAIVGESGSGKSTLLNVISGLDTYEEGELFINGEETSHYSEREFEEYRRKYVANIFQAFNLINSYTVKQNVELVLLIHGYEKKLIKSKVKDILKKVGLYEIRNKRVSKLSGGQKQRVAIARALAKETPIIVADEPTGNLDQKSAKEIFKLLSDIAKDKLVIVVTHNFEQVENIATRVIKMKDGRISEDKILKETKKTELFESYRNEMSFYSKIKLGLRNTFNVFFKFVLVFLVFFVMNFIITDKLASARRADILDIESFLDSVYIDDNPLRIITKRKDNIPMSQSDYDYFKTINGIESINEHDDRDISLHFSGNDEAEEYIYINAYVKRISELDINLTDGKMPKDKYDIIFTTYNDITNMSEAREYLNKNIYLSVEDGFFGKISDYSFKITAIAGDKRLTDYTDVIYVSDEVYDYLYKMHNFKKETLDTIIDNQSHDTYYSYYVTNKVNDGEVYVGSDYTSFCKDQKCIGKDLKITNNNSRFNKEMNYKINGIVNKKNRSNYCDNCKDTFGNYIYISYNDAINLTFNGYYQSSLYAKDLDFIDSIKKELDDHGYESLALRDTLNVKSDSQKMNNIISVVTIVFTIIFFVVISSVIVNVILRSRNRYFAVVRILGGSIKICRQLINIELFIVSTLSYITILLLHYLLVVNNISSTYVTPIYDYLRFDHFVLIYLSLIVISQYISYKFAKSIFRDSMITTYNMEV